MIRTLLVCLGLLTAASASAAERTLSLFGWADMIAPEVIEGFTRETGIQVAYDPFDGGEAGQTAMLAGRGGYDLVLAPSGLVGRLVKAGRLERLDPARLPHAKGLSPDIQARLATVDPGNAHAVPYLFGAFGVAYDVKKIRERLGTTPPEPAVPSWDVLFRPATIARLRDCGIQVADMPDEAVAVALLSLNLNPDSKRIEDYNRAGDLLLRLRPALRAVGPAPAAVEALATGEACLAIGPSSPLAQARRQITDTKTDRTIVFSIPREGAPIWLDAFAIPKGAPHVAEAHAFLDYLLQPANAARNATFAGHASPVTDASPLLDQARRDDTGLYPDAAMIPRLVMLTPPDERMARIVERLWTRVKTGR